MPSAAAREVITAPPTLASDLLKAIVTASTRSRTPACSAAPRPSRPQHAESVRLVDHEPGAEPVAERGDPGQGGELAGHRVDAVDDDHRAGPLLRPFQPRGERGEVVVPEPAHGAPAGRGPGVHAGVRVRVDQQHVAGVADRRQQRHVGVDPGRREHGRLGAVVVGQLLLQLEVQPRRPVEHAAAGGAGAELPERGDGGLDHPRVAGQTQVVVAAEVDPLAAVVVAGQRLRGPAGGHGVRRDAVPRVLPEERREAVLEQRCEGIPA